MGIVLRTAQFLLLVLYRFVVHWGNKLWKKRCAEIQAASGRMICDFHVSYVIFPSLSFFICKVKGWSSWFAQLISALLWHSAMILFFHKLFCLSLMKVRRLCFGKENSVCLSGRRAWLMSFLHPSATFLAPLQRRIHCSFFAQSLLCIFPLPTQAKVVVWKGSFHVVLSSKVATSCLWILKSVRNK